MKPARPVLVTTGLFVLALAAAWWRFLTGQRSPFERDIEFYHHPVTRELVDAWSDGRIPLWTDRIYLGFPFFADPQTAAWYPGTLLVAALGPHHGYVAFLLVHSLLAAVGTLALARAHGAGFPAAWAAGLAVPLSGVFVLETEHPGLFAILCWIPVWLWATRALFLRPTPARLAAASLPLALMIFAGTLQVLFGAVLLFGLYVVGLAADAWGDAGRGRAVAGVAAVAGAQTLGLALAAVVLVPAFAHLPLTARALGMTYEFASLGSVHPVELLGTFVNGAERSLSGAELGFGGVSFYVGSLTLVLAGAGLLGARRWLPLAVGLALGLLAWLALGRHGGLHHAIYEWLPGAVGSLRGMGRALGPAVVGVALLAALGLQGAAEPRGRRTLAGLLAVGVIGHVLSLVDARAPGDLRAFSSLGVLVLALLLCLLGMRRPHWVRPGLAVLVAMDLLAFGPHLARIERSPAAPGARQLAGALRFPALADIADGRFDGEGGRVAMLKPFAAPNFTFLHGLDGLGGYNPLLTLQYLDFVHRVDHGSEFPRAPLVGFVHEATPGRIESPLFQTSASRFLISPVPLEREDRRLLGRYLHPITRASVWLYENRSALPRAYLAYRSVRATGEPDLSRRLGDGFDPRRLTVFEGEGPELEGRAAIDPVRPDRPRPEEVLFALENDAPGLLVLADSWYPGWRAWVDGVEAPVLRVNGQYRGVAVPAGTRRVVMRFEPGSFRLGAAISVLTLLGLALLAAAPHGLLRRRRI